MRTVRTRGNRTRRLPRAAAMLAVAVTLAGCGANAASGGGSDSSAAASGTVHASQVGDVGNVLVDGSGQTVYFAEGETKNDIMCTGACERFWQPVTGAAKGTGLPKALTTMHRPDDSTQLAYAGHPLYTFTQDSGPGDAQGNGFSDSFGGTDFTWHAVTPQGAAAGGGSSPSSSSGGGYGYGY